MSILFAFYFKSKPRDNGTLFNDIMDDDLDEMFFDASIINCNSCEGHTAYRFGEKLKNITVCQE